MEMLLLAAKGDFLAFLPIVFVVVFLLRVFLQKIEDAGAAAAAKKLNRNRPPADREAPSVDLEKFLRELQQRQQESRSSSGRPAQPATAQAKPAGAAPSSKQKRQQKQANQPQTTAKAKPQAAAPQARVQERHLVSDLEQRHARTIHSTLEDKHLETHVAERHLVQDDYATIRSVPNPMGSILGDPNQIARSFILGEVLGKPVSLR